MLHYYYTQLAALGHPNQPPQRMAIRPISKIAMSVACQHGAMLQHWQVTDIATVLIRRGERIDVDTVPDVVLFHKMKLRLHRKNVLP